MMRARCVACFLEIQVYLDVIIIYSGWHDRNLFK